MDSSHKVMLPPEWVERCESHGAAITESYGNKEMERSRAYSSRGADASPELQALAKMAEVAFCLWCGLDPAVRLRWEPKIPDSGVDIIVKGMSFDVKHTEKGNCILWPANKIEFFDSVNVDAYVLVRGRKPEFEIARWIRKVRFRQFAKRAGPDDLRFDEGTLYVEPDKCRPLWADNHHCICGKWGAFGFGKFRHTQGEWFCAEHRPIIRA